MMIDLSWLQNRHRRELDRIARSGEFDVDTLNDISLDTKPGSGKAVSYYLASLYLQLGDTASAEALLKRSGPASGMKKFCHLLLYCQRHDLPVPGLSLDEKNSLDYLDRVLVPDGHSFGQLVQRYEGLLICGNAPGDSMVSCPPSWCSMYFNDYQKNSRIKDIATVHVVTPSWTVKNTSRSKYLCITGNNIFYRRSNVWKRFSKQPPHDLIFTVPRALWAGAYTELNSSPSAGLLMLWRLVDLFRSGEIPVNTPVKVAGFSNNNTGANHSYDKVPASARHNWVAEKAVYSRLLHELVNYGVNLTVQQDSF